MKHLFMALAVLLCGAVGLASADYILITANINATTQPSTGPNGPNGGTPPMPGGSGGPRPGGSGAGPRPGGSGAQGGNPNQMGFGPPMPMGPMGGPMPNQMGSAPSDGPQLQILAVVEVTPPSPGELSLPVYTNAYETDKPMPPPAKARDRWGTALLLNIKNVSPDVKFEALKGLDGAPIPSVETRYAQKLKALFPPGKPDAKPGADKIIDTALWALQHGRNDYVADLMKKLADVDKDSPVLAAFNQVQADLDKPVKDSSGDVTHMQGYSSTVLKDAKGQDAKGHYVLYYNSAEDKTKIDRPAQDQLARLEDALHTFYYWFALRDPELVLHRTIRVPEERLPALLALENNEFKSKRDSFSTPPVVGDGFFARRENLSVFCAQPQDPAYDMLAEKSSWVWQDNAWDRYEILSGRDNVGYPKGNGNVKPYERAYVGTLALLLKAIEDDSARAGVTHDATRQLLFASGLLPRGVTVPEWVQFGMGSFFETPPHAPWPSPTDKSWLYLPIYRDEMSDKGRKFEGDPYKTMKKIVTDGYFRELKPDELKKTTPELMKARAATWSLMYFLATRKLDKLERYFQLLGQMPRDLALDEDALWVCFARAFDAYDPATKRIDEAKLGALAGDEWAGFVRNENFEEEGLVKRLHDAYENLNKAQEGGKTP